MKQLYVPILRARKGEFDALFNLSKRASRRILPLFDLPRVKKPAAGKNAKSVEEHLQAVAAQISKVWPDKPIFLDAFAWAADAHTDEGEHILPYTQALLESLGVQVNPVVGYDRWDAAAYRLAAGQILLPEGRHFCIRLDSDALDDIIDIDYFEERIADILSELGVQAKHCTVLFDLADLSHTAVIDLLPRLSHGLSEVSRLGFVHRIVAGSSIPDSIVLAVKQPKSVGLIPRREMLIWQSLSFDFPDVVFGDYGVRSPRSMEDVIAPDANGKIRYTTDKQFFIARGHSMREPPKGAQHCVLAKKIVDSQYFVGASFSWGDARMVACAAGEFQAV
ncbi:MAG: beta family protein [Rhodoferax sp.]|nr:beta family protein [Rhodoferax sp.]